MIGYYPEKFCHTTYIIFNIQDRLKLLNSDKKKFKIVVTSGLNLFEKLPSKSCHFGDSLSIKDLYILEDMSYEVYLENVIV